MPWRPSNMSNEQKHINFLGIPDEFSAYSKAKAVILPLPFDGTCSWLKGTSLGPAAIIDASMNVELYDIETNAEPYRCGVYTAEPINCSAGEELNHRAYEECKKYLSEGRFVVSLGGEHSVSYGPIKAHAEKYKSFSILQLDAHTDMRESYEGNPWSHACIMARSREFTKDIVQVGIRSMDKSELANVDRSRTFFAENIYGKSGWIKEVLAKLTSNVYITIDLDVFDLGLMSSTGTPEPGGMGWYEVLTLLRTVFAEKNVVGADVVELMPTKANRAPDFVAARLVYKMLGYKFPAN
ncbi:MAG: agmatinase [Oligoflexia bacterium]|nr:agmatinase [Oligoflexia bacterium]